MEARRDEAQIKSDGFIGVRVLRLVLPLSQSESPMKYYPGYGIAHGKETFAELRKRAEESRSHNERVEELYKHCEDQRKRPMASMVDWATERGIYKQNVIEQATRADAEIDQTASTGSPASPCSPSFILPLSLRAANSSIIPITL